MAELNYHLSDLYRQAFPDLASKPLALLEGGRDLALATLDTALGNGYRVPTETRPAPRLDFKGIEGKVIVQKDAESYLRTPIFQPITFRGGSYKQLGTGAQQGQVVQADYAGWQLPATATAEFKRGKHITKTSPNGASGSVKELWAFGDWDITIRGLLLDGQPGFFPAGQLRELLGWEKVADAIEVVGEMFGYLGIKRLVIEDFNLGKVAGMPNVIPFQLQCSSDEDLILSIKNNQFPT